MIFVSTTRVKWIIYQTISYILILKASLSPLNDPQINVFGTVATFTIAMCDSKFCVALACKFDYHTNYCYIFSAPHNSQTTGQFPDKLANV